MKPEIAELWASTLESGAFRQTKSTLVRVEDAGESYCCLGVLCELAIAAGVGVVKTEGYFSGTNAYVPPEVREWAGLHSDCGEYSGGALSIDNDAGLTFTQIAKTIRLHAGHL